MQYMGGKCKIAKDISGIINKFAKDVNFVSLFCGACAIEVKIKGFNKVILNDSHMYLIEMWKALQNGYIPPSEISKEEYYYIKENKDKIPHLTGFCGFACSFGGKWFGGYANNNNNHSSTSYANTGQRAVLRDIKYLKDATFLNEDYRNVAIKNGDVVYCDPPYKDTTKYMSTTFNHDEYYNHVRKLSEIAIVFCSEYSMPDDFVCIWEKEKKVTLTRNDNAKDVRVERLFIHKNNLEYFNSIINQ